MVKCESLRINMFQTNTWKNLVNFPVTLFNHHHAFQKITTINRHLCYYFHCKKRIYFNL